MKNKKQNTLKDIEKAKEKFLKVKKEYEALPFEDKIYSNLGDKVNRRLREYKTLKGRYFYGDNCSIRNELKKYKGEENG